MEEKNEGKEMIKKKESSQLGKKMMKSNSLR